MTEALQEHIQTEVDAYKDIQKSLNIILCIN